MVHNDYFGCADDAPSECCTCCTCYNVKTTLPQWEWEKIMIRQKFLGVGGELAFRECTENSSF